VDGGGGGYRGVGSGGGGGRESGERAGERVRRRYLTDAGGPTGGRGGHGSNTDSSVHRARGTALVPGAVGDAGLTVLSGPSGVGKGTVVAGLRKKRPDIWLSVSVTTRSPRPGEMDGR